MSHIRSKAAGAAALAAAGLLVCSTAWAMEEPPHPAELDTAIIAAAKRHGVPEHLVRRIIMRESKYNARARNHKYWGLMQISYPTARSMGFKGTPQELLNPVVNLRYAVPYLANAFVCAGKREDAAVRLYAAGYYFTARTRGLLNVLRTADSSPLNGVVEEPAPQPILAANASAQPPQSVGVFGALFSPGQETQAQQAQQPQPQAPQPQVAAYLADTSAAPGQPRPAATETTEAPAGTFKGAAVAMQTSKNGDLAPPKKWTRDGGTTLIARGEQPAERLTQSADAAGPGRKSRHHKITLVATLDQPPAAAQAYAEAPGQDPRFTATASQTAISQATSAPPAAAQVSLFGQPMETPQPQAAPQSPAPAVAAASPPQTAVAADDELPKTRKRSRRAKRHKASDSTQVAEQKAPAAPAADLRPTQTQ